MKKRVASGSVSGIGRPERIASRINGNALPLLPSTLPNRTTTGRNAGDAMREHDHFGQPLGRAHDALRIGGLVGRNQHEARAHRGGRSGVRRCPSTLAPSAAAGARSAIVTCL